MTKLVHREGVKGNCVSAFERFWLFIKTHYLYNWAEESG